ncbi:MAG: DUF2202 domain-containing protein [Bacteroidales bacterium]|jgi:hypothetical protein|nr:DUF2202 domain-containing protein [Bacteroidales bacterium]MCI2144628.1 DUF2202 domain-containing protein [Bacteroidales bacterium]
MKNKTNIILACMLLAGIFLFSGCKGNVDTSSNLTDEEEKDLLQLREEEKLARDVYLYTYEKYGLAISENISNSEQTHMNRVLEVMTSYDLEDPAKAENGSFTDDALQTLYNQLTAEVDVSVLNAMKVGAAIEELDIKDIEEFMGNTAKTDILTMYENLVCGSRNHLRSYYAQILAMNGAYAPQYISQSEFDDIVNGGNENCGK